MPGPAGDEALVAALRRGDAGAFATVVDRHSSAMIRVALAYVPSRSVAEEAVQETWIAVMRGIGIAVLPDYMVEPDAEMERLLPEAQVPSFAAYFVYPAELKNSARVHVFRDFLLAKAQNWPY